MDQRAILDNGTMPDSPLPESLQKPQWPGLPNSPETAPSGEMKFPGEDGGKSLAEMAQRDLVATLQLLTERAQYITGATGAAIALRDGSEMTCRASAGTCAPEVGAQLQVDSGLSGESVRTQQTLRCDDAATDPRVNRESCEALGIASVVVMPLVQGSEVIGVFELFSDKAHAFEARDITALERMGAMVFTALENALAALKTVASATLTTPQPSATASENTPPAPLLETHTSTVPEKYDAVPDEPPPSQELEANAALETAFPDGPVKIPGAGFTFHLDSSEPIGSSVASATGSAPPPEEDASDVLEEPTGPVIIPGTGTSPVHQRMQASLPQAEADILESGSSAPEAATIQPLVQEQVIDPSPVPEATPSTIAPASEVAGLRRCEGCGFPVSEGRQLCLDCERKTATAPETSSPNNSNRERPFQDLVNRQTAPPPPITASSPAPTFLPEPSETSWLASHKLLVISAAIVVAAAIALWLLR